MRVTASILAVIVYALAVNYWAYTFGHLPIRYSKLIRDYTMLFGIVFFVADNYFGIKTYFQMEFHKVLIVSILINLVVLVLLDHTLITNSFQNLFVTFNGGVLLAAATISAVAIRNGHFKNE